MKTFLQKTTGRAACIIFLTATILFSQKSAAQQVGTITGGGAFCNGAGVHIGVTGADVATGSVSVLYLLLDQDGNNVSIAQSFTDPDFNFDFVATAGVYTVKEIYQDVLSINGVESFELGTVTVSKVNITADINRVPVSACGSGGDGTITAAGVGGTGPYTYDLSGAATASQLDNGLFTGLGAGTYSVTVTDAAGCAAPVSTFTLVQALPLSVTATVTKPVNCLATGGTVKAARTGGVQPYNFILTPSGGGAHVIQQARVNTLFTNVVPGSYNLDMTDATGCPAATQTVTVPAHPAAPVKFTITRTSTSCKTATDGKATATITKGLSPFTFKMGSVTASDPSSYTFTSLSHGTLSLTVTDACGTALTSPVTIGSGKTACPTFTSPTPVVDEAKVVAPLTVMVLPNPSHSSFTLVVNSGKTDPVQINVVDLYGRTVHQDRGAANQRYTFGQSFAAGMYIARVLQGNEMKTVKLIKQ